MDIIKIENIVESKIIEVREQQVIIDSDVAQRYEVTTKQVDQALGRNVDYKYTRINRKRKKQ